LLHLLARDLEQRSALSGLAAGEAARNPLQADGVPLLQRQRPVALPSLLGPAEVAADRALRLRQAYVEGSFTMNALARHWGLSVSRVSRLVAAAEQMAKSKT
jgi:hypothetical protein